MAGRRSGSLLFCTVLSILRTPALGALTLKNVKPKPLLQIRGFEPLVTVIVPASTKARSSRRPCVRPREQYREPGNPRRDDGSTDDTAEVVLALATANPSIRLIRQSNGAAKAANHALTLARGDIVVAVDADTLVAPKRSRR